MISFQNVSFSYPDSERPAIQNINLEVAPGTLALVIGESGSGKSTMLRCVNGLVPHFSGGSLQGNVRVNGLNPVQATPKVMSRHVGFIFQDPEAQFVVDRVEDEIAFALENSALPAEEIRLRVAEVLDLLSLKALRDRRLETLSGGERQRVAMATALVMRPEVLVLDEPTSQLDPKSAHDVLETLVRLNRTLDLTVLLAEHRIERVLPFADQLIALNVKGNGGISGPPRQVFTQTDITPPVVTLGKELVWQPLPLTVEEGLKFIPDIESRTPKSETIPTPVSQKVEPYLQIHDLEVRYGNQIILDGINLDLHQGEILVLMGPNGAGKTTLLRTIVGLLQPAKGKVIAGGVDISNKRMDEICRAVGYLPQDPNALLFADSALEELMITLRNHAGKMDAAGEQEADKTAWALLERLGLINEADDYPRDLSVGQRQRVALGAITVTKPKTLLLDEPTRGLDYGAKQSLAQLLRGWRDEGMAILLVTHDVELAAEVADRAAILKQGKISSCRVPSRVMRSTARFTPQIARLFPDTDWLTVQDALIGIRQPFS